MKSVGRRLMSTLASLSLPVAVVASFPYSAIGFKASVSPRTVPSASLIALSPEEEAVAVKNAKTIWRHDATSEERVRTWLPLGDLPEEQDRPVLDRRFSVSPGTPRFFPYLPPPLLPSRSAPPPVRIPAEPAVEAEDVFPRSEMLEMKGE